MRLTSTYILTLISGACCADELFEKYFYPLSIPKEVIRKDIYTGEDVSRGRFELLGGIPTDDFHLANKTSIKHNTKEILKILQCPPNEPSLDEYTGVISLLEMIPPTRDIVESMCAWGETRCSPWSSCHDIAVKYKTKGGYNLKASTGKGDSWTEFSMIRVINGELYYDWPWGAERFEQYFSNTHRKFLPIHLHLMEMTLNLVNDIGNSVFFFGGEHPSLPWSHPFPFIHNAPSLEYNHIAWPWEREFRLELSLTRRLHKNYTEEMFEQITKSEKWNNRLNKAAFFAGADPQIRRYIFDIGRIYPDLIDIGYGAPHELYAFHPSANISSMRQEQIKLFKNSITPDKKEEYKKYPIGTIEPLIAFANISSYIHGKYKYMIVPVATKSTSGRLLHLLAHCNCVIMMQTSTFYFHFTPRWKPWVHFVPISFSGADVARKIRWLQENDDMARQIAENGHIFARSHLRLEDYFCYSIYTLQTISRLTNSTDATTPFNATKVSGRQFKN